MPDAASLRLRGRQRFDQVGNVLADAQTKDGGRLVVLDHALCQHQVVQIDVAHVVQHFVHFHLACPSPLNFFKHTLKSAW